MLCYDHVQVTDSLAGLAYRQAVHRAAGELNRNLGAFDERNALAFRPECVAHAGVPSFGSKPAARRFGCLVLPFATQ